MLELFLTNLKAKYFLDDLNLSSDGNLIIIKKWDWEYQNAHDCQLECVDFVLQNPSFIFFIICSHPNVLTMGRGLQKIHSESGIILQEFENDLIASLNSKVEFIKRGGGLTFHYPGQLVFYPILNTIHQKIKVYDFMISVLDSIKYVLELELKISNLKVRKDLLGLWSEENLKIASIGIAANRFVTYHGLALNFFEFNSIKKDLEICYPCGLNGKIYRTVSDYKKVTREEIEMVSSSLVNRVYEIIERQRSSSPIIEATSELVNDLNRVEIALNTESSLS